MTKLQNKTSNQQLHPGSAGPRAELPSWQMGNGAHVADPDHLAFRVAAECPRPGQGSESTARGVQGAQSCVSGPPLVFHLVSV